MSADVPNSEIVAAHQHCSKHYQEIVSSDTCGCFHCSKIFGPDKITAWIDEANAGKTASCPFCGIDSVIGSKSGFPITQEFLTAMHAHWF